MKGLQSIPLTPQLEEVVHLRALFLLVRIHNLSRRVSEAVVGDNSRHGCGDNIGTIYDENELD